MADFNASAQSLDASYGQILGAIDEAGIEPLLDASLRRDYILTNARGVFCPLMAAFLWQAAPYPLGFVSIFLWRVITA